MKISAETLIAIVAVAFWVGVAVNSVGQYSPASTYGWSIVPAVLISMGLPALLAYLGGRKDGRMNG